MSRYSWLQRYRIHRRAKALVGKQSPQDKYDFMSQCIDALTNGGEAGDEQQAEMICELLWEEQDIELGDF